MVDDEASIRRILETRLSMIGYNVVTACDGTEALESFQECNPDLVVLDVMMPKLDGYGVCQELRKESDVPIVMLTDARTRARMPRCPRSALSAPPRNIREARRASVLIMNDIPCMQLRKK